MKIEQLPGDAYSEIRYMVSFDEPTLIVGFKMQSLIEALVYVTLEPKPGLCKLRKSHLSALRHEFNKYSQYRFFCQTDSEVGTRFAEFFGFTRDGFAWGRTHLVKEAN